MDYIRVNTGKRYKMIGLDRLLRGELKDKLSDSQRIALLHGIIKHFMKTSGNGQKIRLARKIIEALEYKTPAYKMVDWELEEKEKKVHIEGDNSLDLYTVDFSGCGGADGWI